MNVESIRLAQLLRFNKQRVVKMNGQMAKAVVYRTDNRY